jgi:hypothetical protein
MRRARQLIAIATSKQGVRRCLPTALIVGTILSAINQGAVNLDGAATAATWTRVLFNFLTPYVVAPFGFAPGATPEHDNPKG